MKINLFTILLFLLIATVSCSDDDSDSSGNTSVIAEEIAYSSSSSNSGVSGEIETATNTYESNPVVKASCVEKDTVYSDNATFILKSLSNAAVTFYYTYQIDFGLVCQGSTLDNFYYNSIVEGSFDAPKISSSSNRQSNWVLTGLTSTQSAYEINGTIDRTGSSTINKKEVNSVSKISVKGVKIDKDTDEITEGTLNWKISGTIDGESFSYDAVLEYQGGSKAKLTISNDTYYINIETGEVEE